MVVLGYVLGCNGDSVCERWLQGGGRSLRVWPAQAGCCHVACSCPPQRRCGGCACSLEDRLACTQSY
jgi:hypothetical protein